MLVYSLTLGEVSSWLGVVRVWAIRLTVGERMALATAALGALPEDEAHEVAEAFLRQFCGPLPPFRNTMDEARHWADWASEVERKAAMAACWETLTERDRAAFLDWVQGSVAA